MKHCPTCDRYFRDLIDRCPTDGALLDDVNAVFTFLPFETSRRDRASSAVTSSAGEAAGEGATSPDEASTTRARLIRAVGATGVDDHVPPHDDWESWGARLTHDGLAPSAGRLPRYVDPVPPYSSKLTERLRENARAQWFELAAAAFGFATLGFLLHVMAMSPVKSNRPTPIQTASTAPVAIVQPAQNVVGANSPVGSQSDGAPVLSYHRTALTRHKPAVVRGASPVARRVARARGIPRRATVAARHGTDAAVRPSTVRTASRREFRPYREARVDRTAKTARIEPASRRYERTASRSRFSHYAAHSSVRVRTASGRWDRWTPHAERVVERSTTPATRVRSTRPSNDDPSYERIQGDPDQEVIGLSNAISHDRTSPADGKPHGPFGIPAPEGEKHVVYVIDSSANMGASWRRTVAEVTNSIRSLGPDDTFDLVTFNRRAHAFSSTLMPAIPGTEASIIDYLHYVHVGGGADLQQALWLAMELPEVNQIVLVTTPPTAGETDLRRLAGFAASENRNRIRIDTVALVDGGRGASTNGLLSRIAHDSGGQSRLIDVD